MRFTLFRRSVAVLAFAIVSVVALACGPTASAIRPTLPPRTIPPLPSVPAASSAQASGSAGSPAASASVTPVPAGIAQPVTSFPQGDAFEVTGVTVTPGGYMAIGFADTGQGYYGLHQGVTWTSADGLTWQQQVDPAFVDVSPEYVVALGANVYVFGYFSTCAEVVDEECTDDPNAGTVIFRSASGGPWEQLAQTTDMIRSEIDGVIAWNDKLVAWGAAGDDNLTTTIWTSADGLTWSAATALAGLDPIDSVAVGPNGLVAFGSIYVESIDDSQLAAATSSDGTNWAVATVPQVTAASILDAKSGPGGMAGVGLAYSEDSPSVALTVSSGDGVTWSQGAASDSSFENTQLNDLHASSSAYVAVGSSIDDADVTLQTAQLWVSGDGKAWRSLGSFGGIFSQYGASALGPTGLVVFTANEQDLGIDESDLKSTIYGWFVTSAQLVP